MLNFLGFKPVLLKTDLLRLLVIEFSLFLVFML